MQQDFAAAFGALQASGEENWGAVGWGEFCGSMMKLLAKTSVVRRFPLSADMGFCCCLAAFNE